MADDFEDRKKLSFGQAEGVEPLPSQLQLREISQELRACLWNTIHGSLVKSIMHGKTSYARLDDPWGLILREEHVFRRHGMVDDFKNDPQQLIRDTRHIFQEGDYMIFSDGWNSS